MKQIFLVMSLLLILAVNSFAQENDTVKTSPAPPILQRESIIDMPDFSLYRSLYFDNSITEDIDSKSVWLWTEYFLNSTGNNNYLPTAAEPHMLANYHDKYVENSKFSFVKTVLGAAQLGAVGYLAYRSIKKHGFWDNK